MFLKHAIIRLYHVFPKSYKMYLQENQKYFLEGSGFDK